MAQGRIAARILRDKRLPSSGTVSIDLGDQIVRDDEHRRKRRDLIGREPAREAFSVRTLMVLAQDHVDVGRYLVEARDQLHDIGRMSPVSPILVLRELGGASLEL